ncbi:MAG: phage tail sheath family protein [Candidatus Limnocylindria bacterium]
MEKPVRVTGMADYEQTFGAPDADDTGVSVRLFFENGGRSAYVIRAGDPEQGLRALDSVDLFNLLAVPGTARLGEADAAQTASAAAAVCERRRALYLVDPPATLSDADVGGWKEELVATGNAALYFPAVQIDDPVGGLREVPPSGAVAGVIARTDEQRGVWKQPAGTDAGLRGIRGLTAAVADADGERLNTAGINALRTFPGQGIRVWGGRTLASAAEPEWKYVSVRRLLLFIEESIDQGTRWAVFEPNDEPLWRAVRSSIESFLLELFRQGALQGQMPDDAYFVRCDRTTMTQEDIDDGRLVCLVGVAPRRPAEFVLLRFGHKAGAKGAC